MKVHRDKFLALDSYAAIDLAFINGMCGESGRRKVEDLYLKKCVPSAKNLLSVDTAVKNSQSMVESSMLQCMGSSCQGSISAAHSMLCAIQKGLPPCVDSDSTDFLKNVFSGTQYFAVYTSGKQPVYGDSGVLSTTGLAEPVLTGQDAVQALWKDVADKSAKDLTLAQMEPFVTFRRFLNDQQRKDADKILQEVLAAASSRKSKQSKVAAGIKEPAAKGTKRKSAATAAAEAQKAAKSLFAA